MSLIERLQKNQVIPVKVVKPSKWSMFKDLKNKPELFELRAYFEGNGLTVRIEPRDLQN